MSLGFAIEAASALYFPLMGQGSPFGRFGDIWAGITARKIMDHLGWAISVGEPHVFHCKASNRLVNVIKEAPGILANKHVWQLIDGISSSEKTVAGCVKELGAAIESAPAMPGISAQYLTRWGRALQIWGDLWD